MKLKKILTIIFPIRLLTDLIHSPILCSHVMKYWDMKLVVEDKSSHTYRKFNNKVFKDTFCQCVKCGIQKKKSMRVGEWNEWKATKFQPTDANIIEVKVEKL